jgi:integrase
LSFWGGALLVRDAPFPISTDSPVQPKKRNTSGLIVTVPLHPDLQAHLEGLAKDRPEEFINPKLADLETRGWNGLSEGFKRIALKAGIDLQTVQGGGARKNSKRTFHALRHSFTSALANAGVSPELRMKLTGHKTEEIGFLLELEFRRLDSVCS